MQAWHTSHRFSQPAQAGPFCECNRPWDQMQKVSLLQLLQSANCALSQDLVVMVLLFSAISHCFGNTSISPGLQVTEVANLADGMTVVQLPQGELQQLALRYAPMVCLTPHAAPSSLLSPFWGGP